MTEGGAPPNPVGSPPDVVYVLRETSNDNAELRWSLRSLQNLPHRQVWIVGHKPSWVRNVEHIPRAQDGRSKYEVQRRHLAKACQNKELSDVFYLFNDDFFVVGRVPSVPVMHRGPMLAAHPVTGKSRWLSGIRETAMLLRNWGYENPLSYELHVPLPVVKQAMGDVLRRIPTVRHGVQMRSAYGNVADIGGVVSDDVKIGAMDATIPKGAVFVSTSDRSWNDGAIGAALRDRFESPGGYEQ